MRASAGKHVCRLGPELRAELLSVMGRLTWRDGKTTALGAAAAVKVCEVAELQTDPAMMSLEGASLLQRLFDATLRDVEFTLAALPARLVGWRVNRYGVGGVYGEHVDESVNASGARVDLSFTVLLQAAEVGGRLVVDGRDVLMCEGDVFLYPSTTAHGVTRVERGERIAIVGWVQSMVRDHGRREILGDLQRMIDNPNERTEARLRALRNELLRRWAQ